MFIIYRIHFFVLLLFASVIAHAQTADRPTGNASIRGTVSIPVGNPEPQRTFRGRAYRSGSGSQPSPQQSQPSSSPFENTIVSLHPLSFSVSTEPLEEPIQINQENATFIPHVVPVTIGSTVQFINDDPFYHNVFSLTPGAKFNIGRRPTGDVVSQKVPRITGEFEVAGVGEISLFCDIHSQMNAKIVSLDTPYFMRLNDDGTYAFENLPQGRYELRVYNPERSDISTKITLDDGEQRTSDFNLSN